MSAPQKTGWDEFGEYHGPFTKVTAYPCPFSGPEFCPCAAPCERMAKVCKIYPPFDPVAFDQHQKGAWNG